MTPAEAATELLAVQLDYAQRGRSLASAALAGARRCVEWAHYPHDDCIDAATGARFFYHAHDAAERAPGEHGHFHVFVAARGEAAKSVADGGPGFSHLLGVSLDAHGLPTRLFTTNRWVTGERWQPADALAAQLPAWQLRARGRLAPVARWLQALLQLYGDLAADLLHERDAALEAWARRHPEAPVHEDRRLHIVSQREISLLDRLARP